MKKKPNDPAQPTILIPSSNGGLNNVKTNMPGLTKREHFAGLALQGLIAGIGCQLTQDPIDYGLHTQAVRLADVLINELNKESEAPSE